jgi:FKBP-type peptidyl-prolyl cis-trans isomerase
MSIMGTIKSPSTAAAAARSSSSWRRANSNPFLLLVTTTFALLLCRRNAASAFTISSRGGVGELNSSWRRHSHICSLKTTTATASNEEEEEEEDSIPPSLSSSSSSSSLLKLDHFVEQSSSMLSRSSFFASLTVATLVSTATAALLVEPGNAAAEEGTAATTTTATEQGPTVEAAAVGEDKDSIKVYKLPSGLKYVELQEGTGPTPKYGQLCSIAYKGYIKVAKSKDNPNPQPQLFDQASEYLTKHGNGRLIPGLDEGLHTMKVGGTRRIIIPPKLGYIDIGLGPMPEWPWDRRKLSSLLDDMVAVQGGRLIFEVQLLRAMDDEADQGYYQDASVSDMEERKIQELLQREKDKGPVV